MKRWLWCSLLLGLAAGCSGGTTGNDDEIGDVLDGSDDGDAGDRSGDGHPEDGDGMEIRDGRTETESDTAPDAVDDGSEPDAAADGEPADGTDAGPCPVGEPCDDGEPCTEETVCGADGACGGGRPTVCDDGNLCTDDACRAGEGCFFVANTAACDDGDPCTSGDACTDGRCVPGAGVGGWYPDADDDGFGDAHATPVCSATPPAGYVADSSDCCDSVAAARPDQTEWFDVGYTCGAGSTFDYDCNGTEELRYAGAGECRHDAGGTCTPILGWQGATTPACGASRAYVTGCDATCRAATETRTQECR
jgi:hypothetical protein